MEKDMSQPEPKPYYVENVEGSDFTFYLSPDQETDLLPDEETGDPNKTRKRFSYAQEMTVFRLTLAIEDLKKDGKNLLKRLKNHAKHKPSDRLLKALPPALRTDIAKVRLDREEQIGLVIERLLRTVNRLLKSGNMADILADHRPLTKKQSATGDLPKAAETPYRNRRILERNFGSLIKPLSAEVGRSLVCRSYKDGLLSVTFRKKSKEFSYKPDSETSRKRPVSLESYCSVLYNALFKVDLKKDKRAVRQGLLVVTGMTNSAKSEIATGLIDQYLLERKKEGQRTHLVTVEDPIEKYFKRMRTASGGHLSVRMPGGSSNAYTPRERGSAFDDRKDVGSVGAALKDALRQTPTVLFVGETRDKEDWKELIEFAGTGHLIVTTAHAGSLTEAMHKIFEALGVRNPGKRSEIANRLLGIIHIRPHPTIKILVPALWRRTVNGKHRLTAMGLSSLLPYKPTSAKESEEKECLGRAWFAESLIARIPTEYREGLDESALRTDSIRWDLEGV
jgi:hypothetical protein